MLEVQIGFQTPLGVRINLNKVDVSTLVAYLKVTFIFEWFVVCCGSENGYKKRDTF